jgi:hypothetical protein
LRDQLEAIPSYPWEAVDAWKSRALPFFRTSLPEHLEDFLEQSSTPNWTFFPRIYWGGGVFGDPESDNSAEASASKDRANRQSAEEKKQKILAYLDGLLALPVAETATTPDAEGRVIALLHRLPVAIRTLAVRPRGRPPLEIVDEYDLQYLLHAVLSASFADVRVEESTPSHAGNASRMDFLLKPVRVVVETKHTRSGLTDKDVADELIIDKERYSIHPDCGFLICFVYDPEHRLRNPEALENDLSCETPLKTRVLVRPR